MRHSVCEYKYMCAHTQEHTHTSWLWVLIWDHDKHAADGAHREREWRRPGTLKASLQPHLPFWALGSFGLAWYSGALARHFGPCVPMAPVLDCSGRWLENCRQKLKLSETSQPWPAVFGEASQFKCLVSPLLVQQAKLSSCCAQIMVHFAKPSHVSSCLNQPIQTTVNCLLAPSRPSTPFLSFTSSCSSL